MIVFRKTEKEKARTDLLDQQWEMQFFELKKFKKKYGHCDVPDSRKTKSYRTLAKWCRNQRVRKKYYPLKYSPDREKKLTELGFSWNIKDKLFEKRFQQLKKYSEKYGHCNVPDSDKNKRYRALALWCSGQRNRRKLNPLKYPPDRLKRLNELGFSWAVQDEQFEHNFQLLKKYYKKHGHCNVPERGENNENNKLGRWCGFQRKLKKRNPAKYPADRLQRLDELGFCWDVHKEWFEHRFRQLKEYHKKHGHCNVSMTEDAALAGWCIKLRIAHRRKSKELDKKRIRRLTQLGFVWYSIQEKENKLQWERQFVRLKQYKKKYGHCDVSHSGKNNPYFNLSFWVRTQREYYRTKNHRLTPERIKKLNSIGFSWINPIKPGDAQRISNDDLLAELKRLHTLYGKLPNSRVIKNHGKYHYVTYYNHFGSIASACKAAGINYTKNLKKYSDAELLDDLKRLEALLGKVPSSGDVIKHGKYSMDVYQSYFGGITKARIAAGLH